ncbi:MAG: ribbon-helix-helix domain-containing protein [Alphaproteobacteria bacterium]
MNPQEIRKRSVVVSGHKTSVSLEDAFWRELARVALRRGVSVNHLIGAIDAARAGNLSSAIRIFVLEELRGRSEGGNGPSGPGP